MAPEATSIRVTIKSWTIVKKSNCRRGFQRLTQSKVNFDLRNTIASPFQRKTKENDGPNDRGNQTKLPRFNFCDMFSNEKEKRKETARASVDEVLDLPCLVAVRCGNGSGWLCFIDVNAVSDTVFVRWYVVSGQGGELFVSCVFRTSRFATSSSPDSHAQMSTCWLPIACLSNVAPRWTKTNATLGLEYCAGVHISTTVEEDDEVASIQTYPVCVAARPRVAICSGVCCMSLSSKSTDASSSGPRSSRYSASSVFARFGFVVPTLLCRSLSISSSLVFLSEGNDLWLLESTATRTGHVTQDSRSVVCCTPVQQAATSKIFEVAAYMTINERPYASQRAGVDCSQQNSPSVPILYLRICARRVSALGQSVDFYVWMFQKHLNRLGMPPACCTIQGCGLLGIVHRPIYEQVLSGQQQTQNFRRSLNCPYERRTSLVALIERVDSDILGQLDQSSNDFSLYIFACSIIFTICECPAAAAYIKGVVPRQSRASTCAPFAIQAQSCDNGMTSHAQVAQPCPSMSTSPAHSDTSDLISGMLSSSSSRSVGASAIATAWPNAAVAPSISRGNFFKASTTCFTVICHNSRHRRVWCMLHVFRICENPVHNLLAKIPVATSGDVVFELWAGVNAPVYIALKVSRICRNGNCSRQRALKSILDVSASQTAFYHRISYDVHRSSHRSTGTGTSLHRQHRPRRGLEVTMRYGLGSNDSSFRSSCDLSVCSGISSSPSKITKTFLKRESSAFNASQI
ncbi:hypothetical protein KCU83_g151, partial [Aureobasidium melanogenum]